MMSYGPSRFFLPAALRDPTFVTILAYPPVRISDRTRLPS